MKSVCLLALAGIAAAADYPDFTVPNLLAHQPNGGKFDYYHVDFNVTSQNGDSRPSWCYAWWGDSPADTPINQWLPCMSKYSGDEPTDISFRLTQELEIGDFYFALQQNFTETINGTSSQTITTTAPFHISNTTANFPYNCTINPYMNPYNIHASGDCATTAPLSIPVANTGTACPHATVVSLSFPVQARWEQGDNLYITGSIPELGSWDLSRAVALRYTDASGLWTKDDVRVAAGTEFEWKVVRYNQASGWLWECGENWKGSVDRFTCGQQTVGDDPTWMRCGRH